ncbi:MAG: hypothetical protein JNK87_03500 [Bryobacterales bacterium]|nr:hypothetical protein [Bryobacterales bacterium]
MSTLPVLLLAANAWAQCSMCLRGAAAQNEAARQALNNGILLLLLPVFSLLAGFAWIAWQRRDP